MENINKERITVEDAEKILDTALLAGRIMVVSGAEIRRAEETVVRICKRYGLDIRSSIFSLTNAIMLSYDDDENEIHLSKTESIPLVNVHLQKVVLVNQLSRDVEKNNYSIEEVKGKLLKIEAQKGQHFLVRVLFAGFTSFGFSMMFGGSVFDGIVAFFAGLIAYFAVTGIGSRISRIVSHTIGGMILATVANLAPLVLPDFHLTSVYIIVGAMMPLVPGLSFTNGFRDIAQGDYLSGAVKLLDAFAIGICMAAGATIASHLISLIGGVL